MRILWRNKSLNSRKEKLLFILSYCGEVLERIKRNEGRTSQRVVVNAFEIKCDVTIRKPDSRFE